MYTTRTGGGIHMSNVQRTSTMFHQLWNAVDHRESSAHSRQLGSKHFQSTITSYYD